jgi:macrolide transport system ATP-binding/permease protein
LRASTGFISPNTGTDHIRVDGLSRSHGARRVLSDLHLTAAPGERLGLLGENGAGKSTLLRLLAGEEPPNAGTVTTPARTRLLAQEVRTRAGDTVGDLVERALDEVRAIERGVVTAAAGLGDGSGSEERYALALDAAERADVWSLNARRDAVLAGLGVADLPPTRPVDAVSGGQRSRFALAALLLSRPTALLLDEPTNHLDDDAAAFLRDQLLAWPGPVVFASHDRAFLDEVATATLDIDPSRSGARRFGGGFSDYLAEKAADQARWEEQYEREQEELARLRHAVADTARRIAPGRGPRDNDKFVHKFKGANHDRAVARRVRDAKQRLDELEGSQVRKPRAPLTFAGIPSGATALAEDGSLITVQNASVTSRLAPTALHVPADARLLLTGGNGAGKSTLLALLAGTLPPATGRVLRRKGLRVALLEQDVRFAHPERSPRELYERIVGERRAEHLSLASLGLLAPRDLDRAVGALSVGQQRRLALALIIARPPHLFLLDEPTNHLSLALAVELEKALGGYPGAVVLASHDRWLRRRWQGDRVHLERGRIGQPGSASAPNA